MFPPRADRRARLPCRVGTPRSAALSTLRPALIGVHTAVAEHHTRRRVRDPLRHGDRAHRRLRAARRPLEEAQHRAALVDGRHAYFIGRDGAGPIGFVIVRDWAARERVTLIKRIAVGRPGRGYGRRMAEGGRQRGSLGCLSRHPFFQGDSVFAIQRGAVSFFDDPAQAVTPLWRLR